MESNWRSNALTLGLRPDNPNLITGRWYKAARITAQPNWFVTDYKPRGSPTALLVRGDLGLGLIFEYQDVSKPAPGAFPYGFIVDPD